MSLHVSQPLPSHVSVSNHQAMCQSTVNVPTCQSDVTKSRGIQLITCPRGSQLITCPRGSQLITCPRGSQLITDHVAVSWKSMWQSADNVFPCQVPGEYLVNQRTIHHGESGLETSILGLRYSICVTKYLFSMLNEVTWDCIYNIIQRTLLPLMGILSIYPDELSVPLLYFFTLYFKWN